MPTSRVEQIFSSVVADRQSGRTLPQALCEACARDLPVSGVGLALMTSAGHEGVVASSDTAAATLEDLQLSLGEGPGIDASRDGRPVLQPDLARTGPIRWPGFVPEVLAAGVAAIFAFPLQVGGIRLGVLDLYRDTTGVLDDAQVSEALAYADAGTAVLLHLQNQMDSGNGLHPDLVDPIGAGAVQIHQATGMIVVQATVGLTEALLLLRAHAFASERPLLEAARDVVARKLRFDPDQGASWDGER